MKTRFVLLHGAWHGGWCWDNVIALLEQAGHIAEAPDLPGRSSTDGCASIIFEDYVNAIIAVLARQPEPVILVGHSSAGLLLQAVAPRVPDKIRHLVFLNAYILPGQKSQFDLMFPPEVAQHIIAAVQQRPDRSLEPREDMIRDRLMAGDPPELQQQVLARLTPEPLALFTTAVDPEPLKQLALPQTVILSKHDVTLPAGCYRAMAQSLSGYELIEIEGNHNAFFSHASDVAQVLLILA